MGTGRTDEFRKDAVRIALTSGLSRRHVAGDLGIGLSTFNKGGTRTATRMSSLPRIASWHERTTGFGARAASSGTCQDQDTVRGTVSPQQEGHPEKATQFLASHGGRERPGSE